MAAEITLEWSPFYLVQGILRPFPDWIPTIVVSELLQDDLLSGELGEEDVLAVDETGD